MKSISIQNSEVIEVLEKFRTLWYDNIELFQKSKHLTCVESKDKRDYYVGDNYKKEIMHMGPSHKGFPEVFYGYNLQFGTERVPIQKEGLVESENNFYFTKKYREINEELSLILGSHSNALCAVYPPGGYISWHNNANATAYNVIFTWSENGDGYWKHVDPNTKEDVVVKDVPGWQCKSFYFGSYDEDDSNLVYHMASTDCWRMTVSYIFDRHNRDWWEETLEEIATAD